MIVGDKMSPHLCGNKCSKMWRLSADSSLSISVSMFHQDLLKKIILLSFPVVGKQGFSDGKAPPLCLLPPAFFIWYFYQPSHPGCPSFPGGMLWGFASLSHFSDFSLTRQRRKTLIHIHVHHRVFLAINGYHEYYLGQWHSHGPWEAWLEVKAWFIPSN